MPSDVRESVALNDSEELCLAADNFIKENMDKIISNAKILKLNMDIIGTFVFVVCLCFVLGGSLCQICLWEAAMNVVVELLVRDRGRIDWHQ